MATRDALSVRTVTLIVQAEACCAQLTVLAPRGLVVGGRRAEDLRASLEAVIVAARANDTRRRIARGDVSFGAELARDATAAVEAWRRRTLDEVALALALAPALHPELNATRDHLAPRVRYPGPALAWLDAVLPELARRAEALRPHAEAADVAAALDAAPALRATLAERLDAVAERTELRAREVAEGERLRAALQDALRLVQKWWDLVRLRHGGPALDLTYVQARAAVRSRRRGPAAAEEGAEAPLETPATASEQQTDACE